MNIDTDILLWVNGHYAEWLDSVMWTVSRTVTWIPLYVLLLGLLAYRYRSWRKMILIILAFALAVGLSDFIASGVLKPLVARLRPTHEPALSPIRLVRGYTGGLYGFCSSHAANTMAVTVLFILLYRSKITTACLMTWVALVSYSRLYLGVHYPSDILAGWIIGVSMAVMAYYCLVHWWRREVHADVPQDGS